MPGPKLFLLNLKLKVNQDPSFASLIHTCVFIHLHDNNNQVIVIPNMIQFSFIRLQYHKVIWMESCTNVSISLISLNILDHMISLLSTS